MFTEDSGPSEWKKDIVVTESAHNFDMLHMISSTSIFDKVAELLKA